MLGRLFKREKKPDVVWFSRDIQQGLLRRWMVVVQSVRIMLVRRADGTYELVTDAIWGWTPEEECQKLAAQGRVVVNHYDRHVLVRIGDTRLPRREVSDRFDAVRVGYPQYFSWTQCQAFLRQFATNVVDRPDWEWQWFSDNTETACQTLFQLPPPPAHLLAAFEAQQAQQRAQNNYDSNIWAGRLAMQAGVANQIQQQNFQINQQLMQNSQNNPGYGS